ncbi:FecR domain-containing protein [Bordetella petrii]|uniref:FecR domain-containing protein n=1 Tax=Bordetella petrii TaxID=94624 RepID=UPI002418166F|nr:FecR domain-containing protein [Bordetella petrii]
MVYPLPPRVEADGVGNSDSPVAGRLGPIPDQVAQQAIAWYVRLASGMQTAREQETFSRWLASHDEHARAWQQLQVMEGRLRDGATRLPPAVARTALERAAMAGGRRRALKTFMWLGVGSATLYLAQDQLPWRASLTGALADVRTATGEQRRVVLEDGTQIMLNTASAIDVRFTARERRIVLRAGEIMLASGRDRAGRPMMVTTAEGTLTPVGTRFSVRHEATGESGSWTRVAVTEGAVEARLLDEAAAPVLVRAGEQLRFTRQAITAPTSLDEGSQAWTEGVFTSAGMRLDDFLTELGRYRPGVLGWGPEVASLRITGAWPLRGADATDRILDSLARRLPVKVSRFTRYWARVGAR